MFGFVLSLYNSQSSSLISMKAVMGSTCLAFQLFAISGPKLNSAMKSSSNSSTSSSTMVKFSKADVLFVVNTKSLIVFTASLRPDSAWKGANNKSVWVPSCSQFTKSYVSLEHCQKSCLQITNHLFQ